MKTIKEGYIVYYNNQGKKEKTGIWQTKKEAEECARFLKFQGAGKVKIIKC